MTELDYDTWNMLDYFWDTKGDVTRWCEWDQFKAAHPNHPLVLAQARLESTKDEVTLLIRGMRP